MNSAAISKVSKYNNMIEMVKAAHYSRKNVFALPYFIESSAMSVAPVEFIRFLETKGIIILDYNRYRVYL